MPDIDANPVTNKLWQGSFPPPGGAVKGHGFKVLVLCAEEVQPPAELYDGVRVIHAPNDDSGKPLTLGQLRTAFTAAWQVAQALREEKKVLVTCMAGRNRSGLVSALALRLLGWSSTDAVRAIRRARKNALTNAQFVAAIVAMRAPTEVAART